MYSGRLSIAFLVLWGCGGAVEEPTVQVATGGSTHHITTGGASSIVPHGSGGTSTGGQVYSTFSGPGCPDASAPTITEWCDVFAADSGCSDGYRCTPYVRASQDPCQPAEFSFVCVRAGKQKQAEPCSNTELCAPGYVCVITASATVCQQICDTSNPSGCAPGMFCDPIDVPGVGTCS